ncbi:hypothetical protein DOTSEDRAFT_21045 [Dothistroma septosporum NZE10]|uniref:BTB domain-containing protein n=1 Tax=Dothistroma septosporum (strain NZE10 / CBS 128990) TaxID=675120 RepID=N1PXY1_DOTSN|nr:hypothetical protein DOTSEDRAFT_21045 [Dothistroma septosporum NZE10]
MCGDDVAKITLDVDFEADTIELMLALMYTGEYELSTSHYGTTAATHINTFLPNSFEELRCEDYTTTRYLFAQMREHANVFAFGDLYQVIALKSLAVQKFSAAWRRCKAFSTKDFMQIATVIFTRDDYDLCPLRKELIAIAVEHKTALAHNDDFIEAMATRPDFQAFVAPFMKAIASVSLSQAALAPSPTAADSSAQMGTIQRDVEIETANGAPSDVDSLRAEHDKAIASLEDRIKKRDIDVERLRVERDKWVAAHTDAVNKRHIDIALLRASMPTQVQTRQRLRTYLDGLVAAQIPQCGSCERRPFRYSLQWKGDWFRARCIRCGKKHGIKI